jgi:2-polyprenyl-6-methoxyphenol hydroxylase-like FAD-dependent oxidoreductase
MRGKTYQTDVLIVGGGPVGLALGLDLTSRGVDYMMIECTDGSIAHPKVGTIGPRAMELFRRWGVARKIRDAGWPEDYPLDVVWVTAVGGHEIYRLRFDTAGSRPLPSYTPEPDQVCPQHWLAPLLTTEIGLYPDGPIRHRWRYDHLVQQADGVAVTVTDLTDGSVSTVEARMVVACDGASSPVRKSCAVFAVARHQTRVFRNILFEAPELRERLGPANALVYFLTSPSLLRFPLRAMDGRRLYRLTVGGDDESMALDAVAMLDRAIAIDTPRRVLSEHIWHLTHRVADTFRSGRVFFAGDSAHTLSPSGGFGMNTGIADAADLGWKISAELAGWAGPELLDSYDLERRPIAEASLEEANRNLVRTMSRKLPPQLVLDTAEGKQARSDLAKQLMRGNVRREFDAPDVHFGFRYRSSLIAGTATAPDGGAEDWQRRAVPGMRAPHSWLRPGVSTLDLFGRGYVLLSFGSADGLEKFESAFARRRVPLTITRCADPAVAYCYGEQLVLVRPDGHVAWCGASPPADAGWLVDQVRGAAPGRMEYYQAAAGSEYAPTSG